MEVMEAFMEVMESIGIEFYHADAIGMTGMNRKGQSSFAWIALADG
jgi:hypothetical protein